VQYSPTSPSYDASVSPSYSGGGKIYSPASPAYNAYRYSMSPHQSYR